MTDPGTVLIPGTRAGTSVFHVFRNPVDEIRADKADDVPDAFERIMRAVRQGLQAAGWIAYEAAPAMDAALAAHQACPVPVLWFGLYRGTERLDYRNLEQAASFRLGDWQPTISREHYLADIERIRRNLADGETYQVNHTWRLRTSFNGDAAGFFLALYRAQPSPCAMYADNGDFAIASISPELFVRCRGSVLTSRPMKGTAPRGNDAGTDAGIARRLATSPKDQAENVMIVDMIRNDMGRIAVPGSVRVSNLFAVETYPSVFQMTSTVTARSEAEWPAIMRAMFPCSSITGAPKVRTMRLIRDLETTPRGVYTGSMGYIAGPRNFRFNVAIRTVTINRSRHTAEYGVGGGIVWDSRPEQEYRECLVKAAVLKNIGNSTLK